MLDFERKIPKAIKLIIKYCMQIYIILICIPGRFNTKILTPAFFNS